MAVLGAAQAGVIHKNVPMQLEAGAFCGHPGVGTAVAPGVHNGKVILFKEAFDFVHLGDKVPGLPGMGMGIAGQIPSGAKGEILTGELWRVLDPAPVDYWHFALKTDGRFWLGATPDPGAALAPGRYKFAVFRGNDPLLVYEFTVLDPVLMPKIKGICQPAVS